MYASFAGFEIPKVYDVQVAYQLIGDRSRTAGGKLRQDAVAQKRVWTLQTRPVTLANITPLLTHLRSTLFEEGAFWMQEFGQNTVLAMVSPDGINEKIVAFSEDGVWHKDGRQLTIVIEEV